MTVHYHVHESGYEDMSDRDLQDRTAELIGEILVKADQGKLAKLDRSTLMLAVDLLNVMCIGMDKE